MNISARTLRGLQNGSDVRGVAMASEGRPVTLTGEAACRIATAFTDWLAERLGRPASALTISVGHDSRVTADALKRRVLEGILTRGAAALDCGLASTPSMFMSTRFAETGCDGAVMITASHLPMDRNGMKFFTRAGGLDKPDIAALLERAAMCSAPEEPAETDGARPVDLMARYAAHLRERVCLGLGLPESDRPLAGLRVCVDAGNGAGGFFAGRVLEPLGADTAGSRFLEPDGTFPNHVPNPEDKTAMAAIREATLQSGADLGLIFDTDVDRMSAVLHDGTEVNRDAIIAMMAAILAPDFPGATVVTDSVTSDRLTAFLERDLGLRHRRFKRGYKNVINEAVRLEESGIRAPLAIETSGHGALSENYFLDDGAYMAVKLVVAAAAAARDGRRIGDLIAALPPACEAREIRIPIAGEDFASYGKTVLETFERRAARAGLAVAPDSCEGVRVSFSGEAKGWLLLRLSLHDPLLPLNAEGDRPGDCGRILAAARELLSGFDRLDLAVLAP